MSTNAGQGGAPGESFEAFFGEGSNDELGGLGGALDGGLGGLGGEEEDLEAILKGTLAGEADFSSLAAGNEALPAFFGNGACTCACARTCLCACVFVRARIPVALLLDPWPVTLWGGEHADRLGKLPVRVEKNVSEKRKRQEPARLQRTTTTDT